MLTRYIELFPKEASFLEHATRQVEIDGMAAFARSNMSGHVTTSLLVVDPRARMALLIGHGIYGLWIPPGGHFQLDNSLWLSAAREVLEETGVSCTPLAWHGLDSETIPIDVDTHHIPPNAKKGEGEHFHHDFCFVARASSALPLSPQAEEVSGARWANFDELQHSTNARIRRLGHKIELLEHCV